MRKDLSATVNQRVDIEIRVRVANDTATIKAHANVGNKTPSQMSAADWKYLRHILDESKKLLAP